ncbi:MAG: gas vesicle protein GvpO [Pseudomonadota bacterium]
MADPLELTMPIDAVQARAGDAAPGSKPTGDAADQTQPGLDMASAVTAARDAIAAFTAQPIDQVVACAPDGSAWRVGIETVETRARVGRNDLLSRFDVTIDRDGRPIAFLRVARRFREDRLAEEQG